MGRSERQILTQPMLCLSSVHGVAGLYGRLRSIFALYIILNLVGCLYYPYHPHYRGHYEGSEEWTMEMNRYENLRQEIIKSKRNRR